MRFQSKVTLTNYCPRFPETAGYFIYTYDAIGNPTTFNGYGLTWDGRQLKKMEKIENPDLAIEFLYNADGIRRGSHWIGSWNIIHCSHRFL